MTTLAVSSTILSLLDSGSLLDVVLKAIGKRSVKAFKYSAEL